MPVIEWPSQMAPLVPQLRRLQDAANGMTSAEFAEALGHPEDDYLVSKFKEFQAFGRLGYFDNHVLSAAIEHYEARHRD